MMWTTRRLDGGSRISAPWVAISIGCLGGYFALCRVKLFAVMVREEQPAWPERAERMRYWLPA